MPRLYLSSIIPATRKDVFEYVTKFPPSGNPAIAILEDTYGKIQGRNGDLYIFKDKQHDYVTWECRFDAPIKRTMTALNSSWSDRTDIFIEEGENTRWIIEWTSKATGLAVYTQWLAFHIKVKREASQNIVLPVVSHFSDITI